MDTRRTVCASIFMVALVGVVMGLAAAPALASFNRYTAANYAETWWNSHNSDYRNYESGGGDCTGFASQALHEGGIGFNTTWRCVWSSVPPEHWVDTPAFYNAHSFHDYFRDHYANGMRHYIGTFDYLSGTSHPRPVRDDPDLTYGGIVSMDLNYVAGQHYPSPTHIEVVTAEDEMSILNGGENPNWVGDLICQHSEHQEHRAWTKGDLYSAAQLESMAWQYYPFYMDSATP